MTDNDAEQIAESDEDGLLLKLDGLLQRYQRENHLLVQQPQSPGNDDCAAQEEVISDQHLPLLSSPENNEIPLLTEKVELTTNDWFVESGISELLCFAFDQAIREAQIKLDPLARITLLQALAKRLPKNF